MAMHFINMHIKINWRQLLFAGVGVFLLVGTVLETQAAAGPEAIAKTREFLARLDRPGLAAKDVFEIANTIGPVIDAVRQSDVSSADLETLRVLLEKMHSVTAGRLSSIEGETSENEAALERLYRSQVWDDISFSLAAFPYWRAWVDLEISQRIKDPGLKDQALLPALKGFRSASMQLFRPGLVYGGWLGLGYVEKEKGRLDRAIKIFTNLEVALKAEPDSPVLEAVQMELRLLEARSGKVTTNRSGRTVDDVEAKILRAEAFALLQDSRKTGGRPLEAADRLRKIINSGRMEQSLLNDMMIYAQEVSGIDVGAYTDLAGAEFALQFEHYFQAMQKYQAFFNKVVAPRNLDLSNYRYHWALSSYKAGIYQPGIDILEKLLRRKGLPRELDLASSKLLYAIYAAREQASSSNNNRTALRKAAERFVRKSPKDPDADAARLMIAQTSSNATTALNSLKGMSKASRRKFKGDVERTAFHIIARDFSKTVSGGKTTTAGGLARSGIRAFQTLPKADKADPFNFAMLLQMRALVDKQPEEVLKAIDMIEKKSNTNLDVRRALVWSRLQLYDRLGDMSKVSGYIASLAAAGIPSWQMEFLYPFVADRKEISERVELARALHPATKDQPDMDRRFRALIIEDLLTLGENETAYDEARAFSKEHPASGDAYKLLAKGAEANELPFEADRAWSVITDKAVPTMTIWWEGMLNRVRIRAASTRPEDACPLLKEIASRLEHMPDSAKVEYESSAAAANCATVSAELSTP